MNLKETIIFIAIIALVALGVVVGYDWVTNVVDSEKNIEQSFGEYEYLYGDYTHGSVITTSTLPTLLIGRNSGRKHIVFCNTSANDVYAHFGNYADANTASTSISNVEGLLLDPSQPCFEMTPYTMYPGDIWLATTSAENTITYLEY